MTKFLKDVQQNAATHQKSFSEALALFKLGFSPDQLIKLHRHDANQFWGLTTWGGEGEATWHKIRAVSEETGYWPILFRSSDVATSIIRKATTAHAPTRTRILQTSSTLNLDTYIAQCHQKFAGDAHTDHASHWTAQVGTWRAMQAIQNIPRIAFDPKSGAPRSQVCIALFETRSSWEIPAFINYGNNPRLRMPSSEMHVAFLKRWNTVYGAELVGIDTNSLQLQVSRPPVDQATAEALAWEHYFYCQSVLGEDQTIHEYASTLLNQTEWFFCWAAPAETEDEDADDADMDDNGDAYGELDDADAEISKAAPSLPRASRGRPSVTANTTLRESIPPVETFVLNESTVRSLWVIPVCIVAYSCLFGLIGILGVAAVRAHVWPAIAICILLDGVFGLVCFGAIAGVLRNRRIERGAVSIPGVITSVHKVERGAGEVVTRISYAFTGKTEGRIYGAQEVDLGTRPLPQPGTPLIVRYLDDKTHSIA